jgi:hypothetical protein
MMFDSFSDVTARPGRSLVQIFQEGLQTLSHLLLFFLLLLGFGGLVYKALRTGGWLENMFGHLWDQHPMALGLAALAAMIAGAWGTRFLEKLPMFGKRGDLLVYGWLALGLFFAFKLTVTGSL